MPVDYIDRSKNNSPMCLRTPVFAPWFSPPRTWLTCRRYELKQLPEELSARKPRSVLCATSSRFRQSSRVVRLRSLLFGFCLGAGLELPLACHFRVASKRKIGLPEMDLGSVPAWGGSARLPRVVGQQHALDMILRHEDRRSATNRFGHRGRAFGQLKARAQALGEELAAQPRARGERRARLHCELSPNLGRIDRGRAVAATGLPDSQGYDGVS